MSPSFQMIIVVLHKLPVRTIISGWLGVKLGCQIRFYCACTEKVRSTLGSALATVARSASGMDEAERSPNNPLNHAACAGSGEVGAWMERVAVE